MGHKNTGYESGGPQGGPRWARSSGTARKSCCHRRDTCGLQRVGEGSIQAPLIPYPATSPARGCCQQPHPFSTPIPPLGHQDTPRFCRNSDLTPICSSWFSNKTPLFLHTNLGRVVGVRKGGPDLPSLCSPPVPTPCPPDPELTYSTVHPLLEWEGLCPQALGWERERSEMCRDWGLEERGTGNTLRSPESTGHAFPESLSYGNGTPAEGSAKNPNFHYFLTVHLPVIRTPKAHPGDVRQPTARGALTQQLELGQPTKPWGSQGQGAPARWAIQSQSTQRRHVWQAASPREAARRPGKERHRKERRKSGLRHSYGKGQQG